MFNPDKKKHYFIFFTYFLMQVVPTEVILLKDNTMVQTLPVGKLLCFRDGVCGRISYTTYKAFHILPQIYTTNHATFPIHAITV